MPRGTTTVGGSAAPSLPAAAPAPVAPPAHLAVRLGAAALQRGFDVRVDGARQHAGRDEEVEGGGGQQGQALRVDPSLLHAKHRIQRAAVQNVACVCVCVAEAQRWGQAGGASTGRRAARVACRRAQRRGPRATRTAVERGAGQHDRFVGQGEQVVEPAGQRIKVLRQQRRGRRHEVAAAGTRWQPRRAAAAAAAGGGCPGAALRCHESGAPLHRCRGPPERRRCERLSSGVRGCRGYARRGALGVFSDGLQSQPGIARSRNMQHRQEERRSLAAAGHAAGCEPLWQALDLSPPALALNCLNVKPAGRAWPPPPERGPKGNSAPSLQALAGPLPHCPRHPSHLQQQGKPWAPVRLPGCRRLRLPPAAPTCTAPWWPAPPAASLLSPGGATCSS